MDRPRRDTGWPPAHPWAARRDEVERLLLSVFTWRLTSLIAFVLLGLLAASAGAATRREAVAAVVPVVLAAILVVVLVKYLDSRIGRRLSSGRRLHTPSHDALRARRGLRPIEPTSLPDWLTGLRGLRRRPDGARVRIVSALERDRELLVVMVTSDDDVAAEPIVVQRLAREVPSFQIWPRWRSTTKEPPTFENLYKARPEVAAVPEALASRLVDTRGQYELDAGGHWITVRKAAGRRTPLSDAALVALVDELITTAEAVAAAVGS